MKWFLLYLGAVMSLAGPAFAAPLGPTGPCARDKVDAILKGELDASECCSYGKCKGNVVVSVTAPAHEQGIGTFELVAARNGRAAVAVGFVETAGVRQTHDDASAASEADRRSKSTSARADWTGVACVGRLCAREMERKRCPRRAHSASGGDAAGSAGAPSPMETMTTRACLLRHSAPSMAKLSRNTRKQSVTQRDNGSGHDQVESGTMRCASP
ncbi:uncharacterized protein DCS_06093 [Drechmeria coniospora]|uniref:Uncharacterized protein n=1 Tax=Drechmeria coniospora TaxID=98403 RepID=A0A151GAL4_DRECN|nr:uncharacterized protein DCS_06093 [Drechmeria coniospora]KYK54136.1 uncharacterized protein DCS_06093 [Drechmeria coniospora]